MADIAVPRYVQLIDARGLMSTPWQALIDALVASAELTRGIEVIVGGEGMAVNAQRIVGPVPVSLPGTPVYTCPPARRVMITTCTVSNPTASPHSLNLFIVPNGASPNATNQVLKDYNVVAGETYNIAEMRHALAAGDVIHAECSTDQQLLLTITAAVIA